jgi:adenylate kinase family enzyme
MKKKKELYIIIGPLGVNKTIYSETIAKFFNMEPIFWGKMGAGKKDKLAVAKKALLGAFRKSSRVIIDGFPTDKDEAVFLLETSKKLGFSIRCVIQLNISLEKIIKNLKNKFICNDCGVFYEEETPAQKDHRKCPNCGSLLIKYHTNHDMIQKDYYNFFNSVKEIAEILSLYSESYFSVSVEQPEYFVISSIFNKIKNQEKNFYTLYERKSKTKIETKYGI